MPVCEGIFSGNPKEAHIVQAGNPTSRFGPLFHACTAARTLWYIVEITADPEDPKRTPRVSVEVAQQQIAQYGRDNPWVQVRIFGNFPPAEFNALIGPDEIRAAMNRMYKPHELGAAARILSVDVAYYGDDASVLCKRIGLQVFPFKTYRNIDTIMGAGIVRREELDWQADAVFIDGSTFGAGWVDNIRLLGSSPIPVIYAAKPHSDRYYNKRAEMYFDACEWIKGGGALPSEGTEGGAQLLAALSSTTFTIKNGKLLLAPKEDVKALLGYSPDHADAFVQTFAEPVSARSSQPRLRPQPRIEVEYDPFAQMRGEELEKSVRESYDPYRM